jgi:hypothetical protein
LRQRLRSHRGLARRQFHIRQSLPRDLCRQSLPRDLCSQSLPRDRCSQSLPRDRCSQSLPRDLCRQSLPREGVYTLRSLNAEDMTDVEVVWASPVLFVMPKQPSDKQ